MIPNYLNSAFNQQEAIAIKKYVEMAIADALLKAKPIEVPKAVKPVAEKAPVVPVKEAE